MGGMILCQRLLFRRQRRSHKIRRCCSAEWDTFGVFLPIIPDIFLLSLYCRRPLHPIYLLPSLSSINLIIPHIFCYNHSITYLSHICFCCLNRPVSPPRYMLPYFSAVPVISRLLFRCNYQPDSTLHFSFTIVSIILNL